MAEVRVVYTGVREVENWRMLGDNYWQQMEIIEGHHTKCLKLKVTFECLIFRKFKNKQQLSVFNKNTFENFLVFGFRKMLSVFTTEIHTRLFREPNKFIAFKLKSETRC